MSLAFYKALYSLHIFVYFMFLKCNSILLKILIKPTYIIMIVLL
nr:MAG TPA: hypothetical protein [Caudoviricetes sp.]